MIGTGIYVIRDDETLVELAERPYDSEDLLQGLLAKYPHLLAGEQMDADNPRRWLLVSRELGLPSQEGGAARWSVDHLFLDQDGIPTLVEVKRSGDTRIRREVVGQLLEYAAHAVSHWPAEAIRAAFEARCAADGADPVQVVGDFLVGGDPDGYWAAVRTNLQAGRVRLVFVADEVPSELQRVVEFLNGQMAPAEVLAVEIKHYAGERLRTLVPRVLGRTAASADKQKAGAPATTRWDEARFFAVLGRRPPEEVRAARRIYEWIQANATPDLWWGQGKYDGSVYPKLHDPSGRPHWLVALWTTGHVTLQFQYLAADPAFAPEERRLELLRRLNAISGVSIPAGKIALFPSIRLAQLTPEGSLDQFIAVLDWAVQAIRAAWS